MALSDAQLVMLDNLIYTDFCRDNDTVETILTRMEAKLDSGGSINCCEMSNDEWRTLIRTVRQEPALLKYTVQHYENNSVTGMRAACFVDDINHPQDVNIVFRGTSGDYEWHDNGEGGYLSETAQQRAAAEYVNRLPVEYGNAMTVTGHSKGGNKAQFVTITTDRIVKCVSVDGQGFSKEFLEQYEEQIRKKANSIVSISASNDVVNCLLFPIAGTRIYIETESQDGILLYHKPNILLDGNGNLRPQEAQSALSLLINEYTTYMITALPEPERSITIDGLIAVLESGDDKETIWQTLYAGVVAVSHVDDFSFHYIGDTYGFPARLAATYLAALYCPYLFADDLLECGKEMVDNVLEGMCSLASVIGDRLTAFGEKVKEFGSRFVQSISSFASQVRVSYNMIFNRGYQYAVNNTLIEVNTTSLRSYADRLTAVNRRIRNLDQRMDSLYKSVGLRDLLKLLRADLMTSHNWRIDNCVTYLNETANDFEKVEREIATQY